MRLVDRYVIKELLAPFIFGVAMFTAILLGASVLPQIAKLAIRGATAWEMLAIFFLSLPTLIVVTGPMAMLLAALMGIGRISSESELVAALASGISLQRIAAPVLAMALAVGAGDFLFQEKVVPRAAETANRVIEGILARTDVVSDRPLLFFDRDPSQGRPRLMVGADKLRLGPAGKRQSGTLLGVKIVLLDEAGDLEGVAHAREARFDPDQGKWRLYGTRYWAMPTGEGPAQALPPQEIREALIDFGKPPADIGRKETDPEELTVRQLREKIKRSAENGFSDMLYTRRCEVELHHRFSVPFAAIVFALIGVPLGLRRQRTGSSLGLGLSVLIIFVYYILWYYLGTLGKGDAIDPFLAAWIPNAVGIAMGVVLLQRAPK